MAKCGRLELGDNVYGHNRSIFNHCEAIEFGEKHKIRAITPFKVIQGNLAAELTLLLFMIRFVAANESVRCRSRPLRRHQLHGCCGDCCKQNNLYNMHVRFIQCRLYAYGGPYRPLPQNSLFLQISIHSPRLLLYATLPQSHFTLP